MNITKKHFLVALSALLVFQVVAMSDFEGAFADDIELITVGSGAALEMPPPNIMFYFDSSNSSTLFQGGNNFKSTARIPNGIIIQKAAISIPSNPTNSSLKDVNP